MALGVLHGKAVKDFAKTKHENLPNKKEKEKEAARRSVDRSDPRTYANLSGDGSILDDFDDRWGADGTAPKQASTYDSFTPQQLTTTLFAQNLLNSLLPRNGHQKSANLASQQVGPEQNWVAGQQARQQLAQFVQPALGYPAPTTPAPQQATAAPGDAVRGTPMPNVIGRFGPMRVDGTFDGGNAGQSVQAEGVMKRGSADNMDTNFATLAAQDARPDVATAGKAAKLTPEQLAVLQAILANAGMREDPQLKMAKELIRQTDAYGLYKEAFWNQIGGWLQALLEWIQSWFSSGQATNEQPNIEQANKAQQPQQQPQQQTPPQQPQQQQARQQSQWQNDAFGGADTARPFPGMQPNAAKPTAPTPNPTQPPPKTTPATQAPKPPATRTPSTVSQTTR